MAILFPLVLCFLLSLGLAILLRRWLLDLEILDRPNARSSHTLPVPRGGGLAVVFTLLAALVWNAVSLPQGYTYSWLMAGVGTLALISWRDDRKGVPAGIRLCFHLFAAFLGTLFWPTDAFLFGGALPFALDRAVMVFAWALYMNLYNFMDGIDGITATETVSLAAGAGLSLAAAGLFVPGFHALTAAMIGASLGFLILNWHPAKIFLGDVGSVPLGYVTGFCLITLALRGQWAAAIILPMYYLGDSGLTLLRRALRGEKIWEAHREHFYQKAAARWKRHDKVTLAVATTNAGLIALAALSACFASVPAKLCLVATAAVLTGLTLRKLGGAAG